MSIVRHPFVGAYGVQRDLQREMNRLFDTFFPQQRRTTSEQEGAESAVWRPTVDIHEDKGAFYIDAELPGVKREDVRINFEDGTLTLSGERSYRYESSNEGGDGQVAEEQKSCHRMERFYGKFFRSFSFPTTVNPDDIRARFENGILHVTVPKADVVKPRQIEIG